MACERHMKRSVAHFCVYMESVFRGLVAMLMRTIPTPVVGCQLNVLSHLSRSLFRVLNISNFTLKRCCLLDNLAKEDST